ncbi:hypothetical protein ACLMJK_003829 [Lecanora helva]
MAPVLSFVWNRPVPTYPNKQLGKWSGFGWRLELAAIHIRDCQGPPIGLPLTPGLQSDTSLASSSKPSRSLGGHEVSTLATFTSPTAKVEGTLQSLPVSSNSTLATALPQTSSPSSISPTSSTAPSTQILLVPILRNILDAGKTLSAEITIPASKTKFISSIESTEPILQQKFDSMGGTDITSTRCAQPGGGIFGNILQLVGCAFNSLEHLKAGVDAPDGSEPDVASINHDLIQLGEISSHIAEEEEQSDEDRPSISTGDSDPSMSATSKTSSSTSAVTGSSFSSSPSPSPNSSPNSSPTSSPNSSPTSLSSTSSMSSSESNNSSEILAYRTPIVGYPGPPLSLDAAADGIFEVIDSVLMSAYNTSSLISLTLPYNRSTIHLPNGSMVSALIRVTAQYFPFGARIFGFIDNTAPQIIPFDRSFDHATLTGGAISNS